MSLKIPISSYHKMIAPKITGVAKNDAERKLIGQNQWVQQLQVKGSTVWTEDSTPTLKANMKTYLPMNNFAEGVKDDSNAVYDYIKNAWWKFRLSMTSYEKHMGSMFNNYQPPLSYLPGGARRVCATNKANAHNGDFAGNVGYWFRPAPVYKPNNDAGYLGKNYSVSMMIWVDRNAAGKLHQFEYAQANAQRAWLNSKGGAGDATPVMLGQACHKHEVRVYNKGLAVYTFAQGTTGDLSNQHYVGISFSEKYVPNKTWCHLLITVRGTKVQYSCIANPLGGYTGNYGGTSFMDIGWRKVGNGANTLENVSEGSHRGEWCSNSGNAIRVAELRGYNTPIDAGTKSARHIMNHRTQKGDLPSNFTYPDLMGDDVYESESNFDQESFKISQATNNLSLRLTNLINDGNVSKSRILDEIGEIENEYDLGLYDDLEKRIDEERNQTMLEEMQHNANLLTSSGVIEEFKGNENL